MIYVIAFFGLVILMVTFVFVLNFFVIVLMYVCLGIENKHKKRMSRIK